MYPHQGTPGIALRSLKIPRCSPAIMVWWAVLCHPRRRVSACKRHHQPMRVLCPGALIPVAAAAAHCQGRGPAIPIAFRCRWTSDARRYPPLGAVFSQTSVPPQHLFRSLYLMPCPRSRSLPAVDVPVLASRQLFKPQFRRHRYPFHDSCVLGYHKGNTGRRIWCICADRSPHGPLRCPE